MSDQLHVELEPAQLRVEPGTPADCAVRVVNLGDVVEEYELSVVGLPPGVGRIEPPVLSLLPDQEGQARVVLDPSTGAGVPAGRHVAGVRAASRNRPHAAYVAELSLEVAAVDALTLQVTPQTVRAGGSGRLRAEVHNAGNRPADVSLRGSDNEGAVAFSFEPQRLRVAPGTSAASNVSVSASRGWTGAPRHRQLSISAGGAEAHATFVQKPRLPAGLLAALGTLVALLLVGGIALCADGECFGTPAAQVDEVVDGTDGDGEDDDEPDEIAASETPPPSPSPSPTEASESPSPSPSPAEDPVLAQVELCQALPPDPVPAEAERVEETVGDLDGDDLPDRLTTYRIEGADGTGTYYLRVETAIGFVATQVLDQASDVANIRPLGANVIGEGPQVAFVQEDSGASVTLVSLWGLHADEDAGTCELKRITLPDPTASSLFSVGGSANYGNGLECREDDDGATELWVWEAQWSEEETGYVGRGVAWSWPGSGALTYVEATGPDLHPLSDEQIEKGYGLNCPDVR